MNKVPLFTLLGLLHGLPVPTSAWFARTRASSNVAQKFLRPITSTKPALRSMSSGWRCRPLKITVPPALLHTLDNALQGIQCRGIHRANQVQAQNEHARQLADSLHGVLHFFRRAKEERAKDAINEDTVRNLLSLGDLLRGFESVLVRHQRHFRGLRNPVDEQDCGKHHAHFHRHDEIENYRENKGRKKTTASLRGIRLRRRNSCHSPIRNATITRTADIAATGM